MKKLALRKSILIILFLSILFSLFFIFKAWFSHNKTQEKVSKSISEIVKPNQSLFYSNEATKSFIAAGIEFNEYLQSRNPIQLKNYQTSINKMAAYLDSLTVLSKTDIDFSKIIIAKKGAEKQVGILQKQLDSLMNKKTENIRHSSELNFKIQKYDYDKILSSITYDTVKKVTETKKKGLFGRIGSAIAGKSETEKQEIQSTIKMVFNNQVRTGTFEDQLRNTFKLTEEYYTNNFQKLKKAYNNLKNTDKNLLKINKLILIKSQEILIFYTQSAQEATLLNYTNSTKKYNSEIFNQEHFIISLLVLMGISTILLLCYTIYAYQREIALAKAKEIVDKNLDKKNQLIGMLSHEMRAPLNIITNYSEKLKNYNTDKNLSPTINSINFASNSLQIMVSQILDFIKNENNKLKLYNTKVNLKNEINSNLESLKSLSDVKNIQIISNIDINPNIQVWADKVKIQQLFYNIIVNAIKFTKKGTITVDAKLTSVANKLRLDVSIADTGIGIPEEDIKNIFDEFYQSKKHEEQLSQGAGLGLNLCKNIVEMHNGTISVKSKVNEGTVFSFNLTLEQTSAEQESAQTILENKAKLQKIKIAIVDDDHIMVSIMKRLVSKVGFEAIAFDNAPEIIEYLNSNMVDLIITDIQIADYSGHKLLKVIKSMSNKNSIKPIFAITGNPFLFTIDENVKGFDEIIIKPINKEEFYQKISNFI
jgi:signal transduction histidine kinase